MDFKNNSALGVGGDDARHLLASMLAEMIANDPDAPEAAKLPVRVMMASRELSAKLYEITREFAFSITPSSTEEDLLHGKEFEEYIHLMGAGLEHFWQQYNNK